MQMSHLEDTKTCFISQTSEKPFDWSNRWLKKINAFLIKKCHYQSINLSFFPVETRLKKLVQMNFEKHQNKKKS